MITRKLRFNVLQHPKTKFVNFPLKKVSKKIALQKNVQRKKFLELRFDLIGNAYSAEITFMFLLILSRTRKMLIKNVCSEVLHTKLC